MSQEAEKVSGRQNVMKREPMDRKGSSLIFYIAAIRPLINLDSEGINLVFSYHVTYVKFCRISTALTVSNLFAVDPEMVGTVHTFESKTVQNFMLPTIWDREISLVQACWVLRRNKWWVRRKWVVDIGVVWMTIALELPVTWNTLDRISLEANQTLRRYLSTKRLSLLLL